MNNIDSDILLKLYIIGSIILITTTVFKIYIWITYFRIEKNTRKTKEEIIKIRKLLENNKN